MRVLVVFVSVFFMLGGISTLAEEIALDEESILTAFGLDAANEVTYQNEAGEVIPFGQFVKLLMDGRAASLAKSDGVPSVLRLSTRRPRPSVPTSFPELDLIDLDGNAVRDVDFRGHELLVNFFYAECAPCIEEVPALNEFARLYPDIRVLAMTFDEPQIASQYARDHGFEWPIVPGAKEFIDSAGVDEFPTFVLIDNAGRLVGMKSGVPKRLAMERTSVEHIESLVSSLRETRLTSDSELAPQQ